VRAFVDSGVLIEIVRGGKQSAAAALAFLRRSDVQWLSSSFLQLELMPNAYRYSDPEIVEFYEHFFDQADVLDDHDLIVEETERVLERASLGLADALHIAAASILQADVFVTMERSTKPMYKNGFVRVQHVSEM